MSNGVQTIRLQVGQNGAYFCEPMVTQEEWRSILDVVDVKGSRLQLDALLMFFRQEGHKSTCRFIAKEFAMSANAVNSLITHFNKYAQNYLGHTFTIKSVGGEEEIYWPISMLGTTHKEDLVWEIRPELCAALEDFLISKMLKDYREVIIKDGLDNELYKWRIIKDCQGKTTLEIIDVILSPLCNLVEKGHMGATIMEIRKADPETISKVFDLLREDKSVEERISDFSAAAKAITPSGKTPFGDERTAAAFLSCIDPQHYSPYTSTLYENYCKYLGVKSKTVGRKYAHFLQLLEPVVVKERIDSELQKCLKQRTGGYIWSDILNAQDVLWQMAKHFRDRMPKNWLQKEYDDAIGRGHWVYKDWYPSYVKSVDMFRGMFAAGQNADSVSASTREYFIRTPDNSISSNGQGTYSIDEYGKINNRWADIYSLLSGSVAKGVVTEEDDDALSAIIRPLAKKDRKAARHRLWAGIFPEMLTTIITDSHFYDVYHKIRLMDEALPAPKGKWLTDNMALMKYFNEKVSFKEPLHRALFAWYLHEELKFNDSNPAMEKYKNLLLANHNLILTGAPGTGKTYLAKMIAREIGAEEHIKMVQFHPSYDYTDFVEGLRPRQNGDGFERVNGVFKQFCEDILQCGKNGVFIIDEINRGELSKIFGELFFSIDPDYRGSAGLVETQYQNMVEPGDPFGKGFYVPEGVYIIGTMNDIDRGVESLDLAIRRRFAWAEVTAESRVEMLYEKIPEDAEKAKKSMKSLNDAITGEKIGLTSAYHIGPAYYTKLVNYDGDFESLWEYHIKVVLLEYLRGVRDVGQKMELLKLAFDAYKK